MTPILYNSITFIKKGRESQQQVTDTALKNSATDTQRRTDQYNAGNTDVGQLESNGQPGGLSPAAEAILGQQMRKIQSTYNNQRQVGLARIAGHNMGTLTGETSSMNANLDRGQAQDELAAHENAQILTHQDLLNAMNARMGLQHIYDPNPDLGTASESALRQSQMGSTLGDIGAGLSTAASIGSNIVGMGGLNNLPGKVWHG